MLPKPKQEPPQRHPNAIIVTTKKSRNDDVEELRPSRTLKIRRRRIPVIFSSTPESYLRNAHKIGKSNV